MGKLEDTFNIDTFEGTEDDDFDIASPESIAHLDSLIESEGANSLAELGEVVNLKDYDKEMNLIADKAIEEFDDVILLGKDCQANFAGEIINSAASLMKLHMDARTNKAKIRIQLLDLAIKKQRNDLVAEKLRGNEKAEIPAEGQVMDRNALLKMLEETMKDKKKP